MNLQLWRGRGAVCGESDLVSCHLHASQDSREGPGSLRQGFLTWELELRVPWSLEVIVTSTLTAQAERLKEEKGLSRVPP